MCWMVKRCTQTTDRRITAMLLKTYRPAAVTAALLQWRCFKRYTGLVQPRFPALTATRSALFTHADGDGTNLFRDGKSIVEKTAELLEKPG